MKRYVGDIRTVNKVAGVDIGIVINKAEEIGYDDFLANCYIEFEILERILRNYFWEFEFYNYQDKVFFYRDGASISFYA